VAGQADAIEAQGRAVAALEGRLGEQARTEGEREGAIARHEAEIVVLRRGVVLTLNPKPSTQTLNPHNKVSTLNP
jgi:hypothetical protein